VLQAQLGISKHMGGREATDELASMVRLTQGQLVLEVGCGVGATTSYLASRYGCQMVGVDLSPAMTAHARQRARRSQHVLPIDFQTADAQELPFLDDTFDAVIDESVTAFAPDRARVLREYTRVVRPGGFVGLNEVTWMRPPAPALVDYVAVLMDGARFEDEAGWRVLLQGAGLGALQVRLHRLQFLSQYREELRTLDLAQYTTAWRRFLSGLLTQPAYRAYSRKVFGDPGSLLAFVRSIGYGLYVGQKATSSTNDAVSPTGAG
jgi:SAM-dependent methyltransferase